MKQQQYHIYLILFFCLALTPLFGQTKKQFLEEAEKSYATKNFYASLGLLFKST
jgi:hypothetical protein